MCGLAGFVQSHGFDPDAASRIAARMASAIAHRGPDGSDVWTDTQSGTALAHRRLAIIDLSAAGHQPMESVSGRYVLTYNGEIYNHKELRASLGDKVVSDLGEVTLILRHCSPVSRNMGLRPH